MAEQNTESDPEPPTPPAGAPAPPASGGRAARLGWGVKEMSIAVGVLVVAILGLGAITHSFTFNPGGPSTNVASGGPSIDENQQFQLAVGQLRLPLREPKLPAGWHPNSADLDQVGANTADGQPNDLRIGFITPAGRYVALAESSANAPDLARQEAGLPAGTQMGTKGTVEVDGKTWTIYQGTRSEVSWALDLGPVRILITGNGDQAEFTTMATAVQSAPVFAAPGA
ncbi:MAG TPA: DUF4245 domain-containing protein [Pseudonocardiaceae bacterium]|nr:DUF4245 domain-containing protein [Pseudonocardiaceae bacterium]